VVMLDAHGPHDRVMVRLYVITIPSEPECATYVNLLAHAESNIVLCMGASDYHVLHTYRLSSLQGDRSVPVRVF
jgi:hypothetical protein